MAAEVLVLGGGFAGVSVASELDRRGRKLDVSVTLVRENYLLFTPMLPEAAGGSVEMRHNVQPLRASLRPTKCELLWIGR